MLEDLRKTLKGETPLEKLADVNDRLFMIDMVDRWQEEDRKAYDSLTKLKKELENEINGRKEN